MPSRSALRLCPAQVGIVAFSGYPSLQVIAKHSAIAAAMLTIFRSMMLWGPASVTDWLVLRSVRTVLVICRGRANLPSKYPMSHLSQCLLPRRYRFLQLPPAQSCQCHS